MTEPAAGLYRYIVDWTARDQEASPRGNRPLVCISPDLYRDLPDGTVVYGPFGSAFTKGTNPDRDRDLANNGGQLSLGFPATAEDMQNPKEFWGPYRQS